MGKECLMYHNRLAQLIAIKKGSSRPKPSHGSEAELYSHSWDLRWFVLEALVSCDIKNVDIVVEVVEEPFNRTIDVFPYL